MISKSVAQIVCDLLTEHEELRDNDRRLIVDVWCCQMGVFKKSQKHKLEEISLAAWFSEFVGAEDSVLAFPDHITRQRRDLQKHFPQLRGKRWEERQRAAEARREAERVRNEQSFIGSGYPDDYIVED